MGIERLTRRRASLGNAIFSGDGVTQAVDVVVTHAQLAAIRATPVTLVPAPGAGRLSEFVAAIAVSSCPVTAYTETADNLAIRQTNGSGVIVSQAIETTGFLDQVGNKATTVQAKIDAIGILTNKALVLHNTGDGELASGAAANTLTVRVLYRVHDLSTFPSIA